jgi:hypothetical protein
LPLAIQPYLHEHESAVREFNLRLRSGGAESNFVFFERAKPDWLAPSPDSPLFNEFFVALNDGVVRGGYALKHQNFSVADGSIHNLGYYHHPLSEGIVNKAQATIGGLLLRDALQRSPLLYCLGMGGYDRPLPKMLVRLGWSHCLIPFYCRILRPVRFLREMQTLRTSPLRKLMMDLAAYSGGAWAALKGFQAYKLLRVPQSASCEIEVVEEFEEWADSLWQRSRLSYTLTAVRDSATLRTLYPATDKHFTRLRVRRSGKDMGWAVVGERRKDPKYGALRVGSILDVWAQPVDALPVIRAATRTLELAGMDLIVSNQSHKDWCAALENAGFLQAQSNFIFAASKRLAELLQAFEEKKSFIHFTRADGDGLPRNF